MFFFFFFVLFFFFVMAVFVNCCSSWVSSITEVTYLLDFLFYFTAAGVKCRVAAVERTSP